MAESNAYILGTEWEELNRLGIQHQVWASEAQASWRSAGFTAGDTLLDLGSGPGFCTRELAYIVGNTGKVIGLDKSQSYIDFLNQTAQANHLNMEGICVDFNDIQFEDNSLDGVYCRWALAWFAKPKEVLTKVYKALKPGGKMVFHEYYDWTTHQTEPSLPALKHAIERCYASFKEQEGDIDIGRFLPGMLSDIGASVISCRPMAKMARPADALWQWPKSFYQVYFPKLVDLGYLTSEEVIAALNDHHELESNPNSTLNCPLLIEVIAQKNA